MNEQDGTQSSTKQRKSRKTSIAKQQNGKQVPATQRPANDDTEGWKAYWKERDQPWRTEPEIDEERQKYLAERRSIMPKIEKGVYPFKDVEPKLSRADIEWLLATHENGRGPVDWSDEGQRNRTGLDLRGANLSQVNMSYLPLARMYCGMPHNEWVSIQKGIEESNEQRQMAAANMREVNLEYAHLEGVEFFVAQMERARLYHAHLEEARLINANLKRAFLSDAHLERADLAGAHLEWADLIDAHLEQANLTNTYLEEAFLIRANLERAKLSHAHLERANLYEAQLERAILIDANLERANLSEANLERADLRHVFLSNKNHVGPRLADAQLSGVNLTVVDWSQVEILGDDYVAQEKEDRGKMKNRAKRLEEYESAVRANRQLTVVLRNQGLNEDAARFAYRAQLMQRKVFWYLRKFGQYLFSFFLDLLAGYGYRPGRSFIAYALVITVFATIYHLLGSHLAWNEAIVISMTAFHGRGFFPEQFHPGDPQALVAAIEAFVGLLIEVTFIATLTQRLFGK